MRGVADEQGVPNTRSGKIPISCRLSRVRRPTPAGARLVFCFASCWRSPWWVCTVEKERERSTVTIASMYTKGQVSLGTHVVFAASPNAYQPLDRSLSE